MKLGSGVAGRFAIAVLLLSTTLARAAEMKVLHGHVPVAVARLQPIGSLSAATNLNLTIGLPLRNREALASLLQQIYDPVSPNYRHYLTAEQFVEMFGPSEQDYQAVIDFAVANALTVTRRHPNRVLLEVTGSAADVEKAF